MGNEQNMKSVQFCTGFIFCTFPGIFKTKQNEQNTFKPFYI